MSKKKKALIAISVIILLFFSVFSIIIIDQIIENDKKWEKIEQNTGKTWCVNPNDLECITNNEQIINEDTEICKKVLADPINYFKGDVERCKLILQR